VPLQHLEAVVEVRELAGPLLDLGALSRDEVTQLDRDALAMAGSAQDGELTRPLER
jgi:hypothetical protein